MAWATLSNRMHAQNHSRGPQLSHMPTSSMAAPETEGADKEGKRGREDRGN